MKIYHIFHTKSVNMNRFLDLDLIDGSEYRVLFSEQDTRNRRAPKDVTLEASFKSILDAEVLYLAIVKMMVEGASISQISPLFGVLKGR